MWHDVRFGLRLLWKDRAALSLAVMALALGIGATTAIFSVIDNVLLEPFPYTDGQRLVEIQIHDVTSDQPYGRQAFTPPEFIEYAEQNQVFDGAIGVDQNRVLYTGAGTPASWQAGFVTGNTFGFLGVPPMLGRAATPADAKPGSPPVFVMSYKLWQKEFAGDGSVLNRAFTIDGQPRTLIGIMPKRFAFWGADLWIPTVVNPADNDPNTARYFVLLGHLKAGLTPDTAAANLRVLAQNISKRYPKQYPKKFDVRVQTLVENVVGRFTQTLYTALGAVGLLLLIACANVANLMLARATAREKEFAIRSSLGAGRWRVIRQLLIESILLALTGAAAGCLFAWLGLKALIAVLPSYTFPDEAVISLNIRVLGATVLVAVLTALLFGLVPAIGSFTRNLSEPLKAAGRGNSGFRRGRLRDILIVSEVALGLVLLAGAGLLMRSFLLQTSADLGLRQAQKLVVSDVSLGKNYKTTEQQTHFARELTARLRALPGAANASAALDFPPFGGINSDFEVAGKTHSEKWKGQMGFVDAEFFNAVGVRLLRGRLLSESDVMNNRKLVVINEAMARKYFPNEDPIGKQVELLQLKEMPNPVASPWFEVIGVSSNLRNHGVREDILPEAYGPLGITGVGEYMIYLRSQGSAEPMIKQLEGAILTVDKDVRAQETLTMERALDKYQYAQPRFALQIFSVFAGIAIVLVAVGIFSVVSYTVSQQNREIGIRMALGASNSQVSGFVISNGMRFVIAGVGVGVVCALTLLRIAKSQFWGVTTYDPITLSAVVFILAGVGLLACYFPAQKAIRVDPLRSLRQD